MLLYLFLLTVYVRLIPPYVVEDLQSFCKNTGESFALFTLAVEEHLRSIFYWKVW